MNRLFATLAPCLLAAALLAACATMGTQADIERLEQRLEATPNDAEALRDLVYMRTRRFEQARPYLARAYAQDSSDAETPPNPTILCRTLALPGRSSSR